MEPPVQVLPEAVPAFTGRDCFPSKAVTLTREGASLKSKSSSASSQTCPAKEINASRTAKFKSEIFILIRVINL